jgi:iron complex transport system ATP-binding protein
LTLSNPSDSNNTAYDIQNVSVQLGSQWVVKDLNLQIPMGQWTCIVGPNAAGKSTMLKALAGLTPYLGSVRLFSKELSLMPRSLKAQNISWLSQDTLYAENARVYDVVMLGRIPHQKLFQAASDQDHQVVLSCLKDVSADHLINRRLEELSGGELQRVLLARALCVQAPIMLMDEPLQNLDISHQSDWVSLIRSKTQAGVTVISVLHELNCAFMANNIVVLASGGLKHFGSSLDPQTHFAIEEVFEERIKVRVVENQFIALHR